MAERSKIDKAGLGPKVLELRKTLTCEEVADVVNAKFLPAGFEPLNKMTVSRYCVAHGMSDMERNDISRAVKRFDAMSEASDVRNRMLKHANKLNNIMDELKEDEEKLSEVASISNAYLNALKQLQSLNESVSKIQREQMGIDKIRRVIQLVLETLRKYPEVYSDFMQRLRESEDYDMIRNL